MTYNEYKYCAYKHIKAIDGILKKYEGLEDELDSNPLLLIDIYYLCGYILEALVVYMAYKTSGWRRDRDIDDDRWDSCNISSDVERMITEITNSGFTFHKESTPKYIQKIPQNIQQNIPQTTLDNFRLSTIVHISGHRWKVVKDRILQGNSIVSAINGIPYIDPFTPLTNRNCKKLLDDWSTQIRYERECPRLLNAKTLFELYETCKDIYNKTIITI